jgi:hypothetical protein
MMLCFTVFFLPHESHDKTQDNDERDRYHGIDDLPFHPFFVDLGGIQQADFQLA